MFDQEEGDEADSTQCVTAIVAYCQVGQRGYLATRILLQAGYSAVNLGGGYKTYNLFQPST